MCIFSPSIELDTHIAHILMKWWWFLCLVCPWSVNDFPAGYITDVILSLCTANDLNDNFSFDRTLVWTNKFDHRFDLFQLLCSSLNFLFAFFSQIMFMNSGGIGLMGYSWPRRLWPASTSQLSRYKCHSNVLFCRFTGFVRKYTREMDTRSKLKINRNVVVVVADSNSSQINQCLICFELFRLNISVQMFQLS